MDLVEPGTQSFIVKIWVEDCAEETSQGVWHGHITHIPGHERRYLKDLSEIQNFITPYLETMGVKPGRRWRFRHWFKQITRSSHASR